MYLVEVRDRDLKPGKYTMRVSMNTNSPFGKLTNERDITITQKD